MKKKIVAIIPIKKNSKRVKKKNFKTINNKKLYEYLLEKLHHCNFDEIYIDSDSSEIEKYAKKYEFNFIKRKPFLARDNANGNDLLNYHSKIVEADMYFQLFITAPLLSVKTINNCIKKLKNSNNFDSILTVKHIYSWFWFNNKAVNYNPKILPRSQDAQPIIQETTGLYGIKKGSLAKLKCRIGKKPYFYKISENESVDLDTDLDFKILETYLKK
jgi:CMP-N-acetylneuraminic acid synthetase